MTVDVESEAMLEEKDNTIFLTCQYSNIKILSAKIDAPIEDGTIIFDRLPFLYPYRYYTIHSSRIQTYVRVLYKTKDMKAA